MEPFKLERHFARYEFQARYMASCSDAEAMSLADLLRLEPHNNIAETWLSYSESNGLPELREAIAQTYTQIQPEQILTHTGAEEPIYNFFQACLKPSDHVIVHFPCYQSLYSVPRAIGCEVSLWNADFKNQWQLDLGELQKLLRPNTRVVVVNSPHNPTGYQMPHEVQKQLIEILRPRGIWLFFDEVYRESEFQLADRLPAACDLYENAISLGVLSKSYGLPGLRVGWIATQNSEILEKMAGQKDYTTICNSVLTERLAAIAIRNREKIIGRNRTIIQSNWNLADAFFKRHSEKFEVVAPRGGTMIFPRAKTGFDMPGFIARLLESAGVMIVGGEHFDMPTNYFRIGLGRKNFPEVLEKIESFLND